MFSTMITIIVALALIIISIVSLLKKTEETQKVFVGTTMIDGQTIEVCEGDYREVWEALKEYKHNHPETSGWEILMTYPD